MTTHTAGPWTVQENGDGSLSITGGISPDPVTNARYLWVANVLRTRSDNPMWRQDEESEQNARLIAAAPDLLYAAQKAEQALTEFFEDHGTDPTSAPNIMRLREAIAKAEGR